MANWSYNPFFRTLEQIGSSVAPVDSTSCMRVPIEVIVTAGSQFNIEAGGCVRIFSPSTASGSGFSVQGSLTVQNGSKLLIENGSIGTVLGA